jgi:hypothetical protein
VEWKAAALNRLFQEQGNAGQAGRITAATVRQATVRWRNEASREETSTKLPQILSGKPAFLSTI